MKRIFLITIVGLALGGTVLAVWWMRDSSTRAAQVESEILMGLSPEELKVILDSQPAGTSPLQDGSAGPEARRAFLNGLREYLALAAQARREGLADAPIFRVNFEHKRDMLLADLYSAKLSPEADSGYVVPKEEIAALWEEAGRAKQFDDFMRAMVSIQAEVANERGEQRSVGSPQGGALKNAKENWARVKIVSAKAKADPEFMARPEVGLRSKVLEAGILSSDYLRKHWGSRIKATEVEITRFLLDHPVYDLVRKRSNAQGVLDRILQGQDFAKLAKEFSEDRVTRDNGGLREKITSDATWPEVEQAALSMNPGQTYPKLIESTTGFHIIRLESKFETEDGAAGKKVEFSFRHILFQKAFEDPQHTNPQIPPPFVSPQEIARHQLEIEKRNKFVSEIVDASGINLPDDLPVGSEK